MVFKKCKQGGGWHEPPYTWEEEMALYRASAMQPGSVIYYGSPRKRGPVPAAKPKQENDDGE
jgi:hypothetical protein